MRGQDTENKFLGPGASALHLDFKRRVVERDGNGVTFRNWRRHHILGDSFDPMARQVTLSLVGVRLEGDNKLPMGTNKRLGVHERWEDQKTEDGRGERNGGIVASSIDGEVHKRPTSRTCPDVLGLFGKIEVIIVGDVLPTLEV